MRKANLALIVFLSVLVTFGLSGMAFAFHGGGVAHCDGCHSMHNSADNPISGTANNQLLKGSDAGSTCLNCHNGSGGYHINSTDGSNVSQGGDFYWMTKDYTVIVRGNPVVYSKDDHGHNVIASDFGMTADANPNNATAPGGEATGAYSAANLTCTSCHDPHGQVAGTTGLGTAGGAPPISGSGSYGDPDPIDGSVLGNYRLLGALGYIAPGSFEFTEAPPVARATNVSGSSYGAIVDYGSGMSEFCSNCHSLYVNDSHKHPAGNGEYLNGYGDNYNSYVATGDFTGDVTTAFDALVPIERNITDRTTLSADPVGGATATSNVMCLTCHRAHASANANAGRWDFEVEMLEESHALNSADVNTAIAAVYYKSGANGMLKNDIAGEYGAHQRSLCNKCHVQD